MRRRLSPLLAITLLLAGGCTAAKTIASKPAPAETAPAETAPATSVPAAPQPPAGDQRPPALTAVYGVGSTHVWVGGDNRIWASTDGGQTWRQEWTGADRIHKIQFVDSRTGWAMGEHSLLRTTDGVHWTEAGETAHHLISVSFLDARHGYGVTNSPRLSPDWGLLDAVGVAEAGGGALVRTDDGGQTWQTVATPKLVETACFSDTRRGWATAQGSVYRTNDGGAAWALVSGPPTAQIGTARAAGKWVELGCPTGQDLWGRVTFDQGAGTEDWAVYRSQDGGQSWRIVAGRILPTSFSSAKSGPVAVVDPHTLQAGAKFSIDQTPLFGWPGAIFFTDAQHGWVVNALPAGDRWDIMFTMDGGATWRAFKLPTAAN